MVSVLAGLGGCYQPDFVGEEQFPRDFSTPQGAILKLQDAYAARDLEAAMAAKDFAREAQLMLAGLAGAPYDLASDSALVDQTARTLELAFRAQLRETGFPDMSGTHSSFSVPEPYADGVVVLTERIRYPEGGDVVQRILVVQTPAGWRVLNPLD